MSELSGGPCGVCISSFLDGDCAEFSTRREVKARKAYKCCECRAVIAIGTIHEYVVGKWDGDMASYRTCLPCAEIRQALCCDGWTYTTLWDDASDSELFDRMTTGCLDQLTTAAAKAKLLDRWRIHKDLA